MPPKRKTRREEEEDAGGDKNDDPDYKKRKEADDRPSVLSSRNHLFFQPPSQAPEKPRPPKPAIPQPTRLMPAPRHTRPWDRRNQLEDVRKLADYYERKFMYHNAKSLRHTETFQRNEQEFEDYKEDSYEGQLARNPYATGLLKQRQELQKRLEDLRRNDFGSALIKRNIDDTERQLEHLEGEIEEARDEYEDQENAVIQDLLRSAHRQTDKQTATLHELTRMKQLEKYLSGQPPYAGEDPEAKALFEEEAGYIREEREGSSDVQSTWDDAQVRRIRDTATANYRDPSTYLSRLPADVRHKVAGYAARLKHSRPTPPHTHTNLDPEERVRDDAETVKEIRERLRKEAEEEERNGDN